MMAFHLNPTTFTKKMSYSKLSKLLKSYLSERHFFVKQYDVITEIRKIQSRVPQGNVLGSLLYLYTADLPTDANVSIVTFADNMVVLAMHKDSIASKYLQNNLNLIQN